MSFILQEPTFNITKSNNAISLLKFYGVNLVIGFVIALVVALIGWLVGGPWILDMPLPLLLIGGIVVLLCVNLYTITTFEYYDGCYKRQ